ncbi:MAG: AAA family ATPase [Myxococcaceae bacterium]|jgi:type II secretory pathway predicted ATPase ExeA|nr:AAA family ATPase [Myxococcaceae bacterium]
MSYLDFFGLSAEPFSNAPVSRFYFNAPQHQQALTRLLYAVSSMKGLAVLVGDIGAGKTTLARRMLDSLPEEEYEAALLVIIHSGITASWILRRIALQLGVENPAQEKLALLSQLYQRLLQIYEQGRKAVVLIDEAQMLETRELMEEFRGLLNLEVPERKLISFVFFGLPEIEKNLKLDPPLAQRVAMRYRLEPFNAESTEAYIKHRMRLAGSARAPFTAAAMEAVHRRASGTPRVINTLCDNALFEAFLARSQEIGPGLIEQIADNLGLETGAVAQPPPAGPPAAPLTVPTAAPAPAVPATVAPAFVPPPSLSAAIRRDPELAGPALPEGGLTVTATVSGGSVPVAAPRAIAAPAASSPSGVTRPVAPSAPPIVPGVLLGPPAPPAPAVVAPPPVPAVVTPPALPVPPLSPASVAPALPPVAPPPPSQGGDANGPGASGSRPKAGVDLAEIDRYLEGLGKL